MATMLAMCPEKVLRLCAMDCSSPISANTERNTGTCESSATGMSNPACARRGSSPAVFSATVLPPVFGPVITRTFTGGISRRSTGTGSRAAAALDVGPVLGCDRRLVALQAPSDRRNEQRVARRAQLEPAILGKLRLDAPDED